MRGLLLLFLGLMLAGCHGRNIDMDRRQAAGASGSQQQNCNSPEAFVADWDQKNAMPLFYVNKYCYNTREKGYSHYLEISLDDHAVIDISTHERLGQWACLDNKNAKPVDCTKLFLSFAELEPTYSVQVTRQSIFEVFDDSSVSLGKGRELEIASKFGDATSVYSICTMVDNKSDKTTKPVQLVYSTAKTFYAYTLNLAATTADGEPITYLSSLATFEDKKDYIAVTLPFTTPEFKDVKLSHFRIVGALAP